MKKEKAVINNKPLQHLFHAISDSSVFDGNISIGTYSKKELTTESLNPAELNTYENEASTVNKTLDNIFKTATESMSKEGLQYTFTPAQKEAARLALIGAMNEDLFEKNAGTKHSEGRLNQINSYSTRSIGLENLQQVIPYEGKKLALEKFGSQELNNIVVNTVSLAVSAAAQDSFMSLVFPMVVVDPMQSHIATQVTYSIFGKGFERFSGNVDSRPAEYEMILNMYKKELYRSDYTKLLPVVGVKANKEDDSENLLVKAQFKVPEYRGTENCLIAPIKVGRRWDLIGGSQTAADLAKGVRDDSDVLDKTIKLNSIYLEASVGGEERYIKLDVTNTKGITFSPRNDGKGTWTTIAFGHNFKFNTSLAADFRSDYAETSKGKMFGDSVEEQILEVSVDLNVTIDIGDGSVTKSSGSMSLISVNKGGNEYKSPSDPVFKAAEALLAKIKVAGFLVDASVTNTNFRDKGIQGKVRSENYITGVGIKSSIGLTGEIDAAKKEGNSGDYDLFTIEEQSVYIDQQMGGNAITVLFNYIDNMRTHKDNNTLDQVTTETTAEHLVRPYLHEETIDLMKVVDSIKSSERMEDIRSALINMIRFRAIKMDRESNYRDAVRYRFKTIKRTLVAMCDTEIASILTCNDGKNGQNNRIPLTDSIDLIVAESFYPEFAGKLIISYVTPEDNNNGNIPVLNVGALLYSPMLNYTIAVKDRAGASVKELHNILRFEHLINLPIFTVFNVENTYEALEKIAFHTIAK